MKIFEIKMYSNSGDLLTPILRKDIEGGIEWSEALNSGQGEINLRLKYSEKYDQYLDFTNIIEIQEVDETNKVLSPSYTGYVEEFEYVEDKDGEGFDVKIYPIFSVLSEVIFDNGSGKVFTRTNTPGNIIKEIIDYFNTQYGALSDTQNLNATYFQYTGVSIDIVTGGTIAIDFAYTSCLDAIDKVLENTGLRWYIGPNGIVYVLPKQTTNPHILRHRVEIQRFKRKKTKQDLVNKYYLARSGGSLGVSPYQDATSQTNYKIRERYESKSEINDATTQNTKGNQFIADHKNGEIELYMEINPMKSENIKPGDIVQTINGRTNYSLLEIVKIEKKETLFVLNFGKIQTLGESIKKVV